LREPRAEDGEGLHYYMQHAIPSSWFRDGGVWPRIGQHTLDVLVQNFELMLSRNISYGLDYCFCVCC
jgi:hypothetical protein